MRSDTPTTGSSIRSRAAILLVLAAFVVVILLAAGRAEAKSSFMGRTSGSTAETYWTQVDGTPPGTSPVGNVHVGWLSAYEMRQGTAEVFGQIEDWDCPEGTLPGGGGHGFAPLDEEPSEDDCQWKGSRWIEAFDVPFTVDKKLSAARLTGTLTVYGGGHGEGGVVGRPAADIIWTGTGGITTEQYSFRYRDAGVMETDVYRANRRAATMSGVLGPMGFDPDLSEGSISNFKSRFKSRSN